MLPGTILKLLLISVVLLFPFRSADVCTCLGPRQLDGFHPCTVYWGADAVFVGQVVGVSFAEMDETGKPIPYSRRIFRFSVDIALKGVDGNTVEVTTTANGASCGYNFIEGKRYFVYAHRNRDGKLTEFSCGPTVQVDEAEADIEYAEEVLRGGIKDAWIVGAVINHERGPFMDYGIRSPLSGIEVELKDAEGNLLSRTVTNKDGRYEFRGLGVGSYRVSASFPRGLLEWSPAGKPGNHLVSIREGTHCESEGFTLTTGGSIKFP